MDIRGAIKGTPAPRTLIAERAEQPLTSSDSVSIDEETYDGNLLIQEYMRFLKEHDVQKDDIMNVLDAIISTGDFQWAFELFDKIPIRFRMRRVWVEDYIIRKIDAASVDAEGKLSMIRYSNLSRMLNLAGSLAAYGDTKFDPQSTDEYEKSLTFVEKLPYPVLSALCDQLAVFDRCVAVATSDWGIKNFTRPRKAE